MTTCLNAIAIFDQDNIKGTVKFHQCNDANTGLFVDMNFFNLKPNQTHAIHIHEYGDFTEGCKSLGAHFNPQNTTHGTIWIEGMYRHAGDLINNLITDENGEFKFSYFDPLLNLKGDINDSILGRSVVVHEGEDDYGLGKGKDRKESLKTGNAGGRMACAIIGRCKDGQL